MTTRNEEGKLVLDKGVVSVTNLVVIIAFVMGFAWWASEAYGSIIAKQDQAISLLQSHGTDIAAIKNDVASIHARQAAVYQTRIDLNEFSIFADELGTNNPGLKVPSIYRIRQEHPPYPPLPQ